MISPHTKPGTKVVCLEQELPPLPELTIGGLYTVDRMIMCEDGDAGVLLVETATAHAKYFSTDGIFGFLKKRRRAYWRSSFKYLELPCCLTELLETARAPSELEPTQ